jgi:hypothetical protein
MSDRAQTFAELMQAHRSIRQYDSRPIAPDLIDSVLK